LTNSTKVIEDKNQLLYNTLQHETEHNTAAKALIKHCENVKTQADYLIDVIENVKADLLTLADGRKTSPDGASVNGGLNELTNAGDYEKHRNYFILEYGGKRSTALQNLVNNVAAYLVTVLDSAAADHTISRERNAQIFILAKKNAIFNKNYLSAVDVKTAQGEINSWTTVYLNNMPLAGVFALLSKIENDCRTLESEIIQTLAETVGVNSFNFKFDTLKPIISANTSAVLTGQTYDANIILGAYDSKSNYKMTVNGAPIVVKDGVGRYRAMSNSPGEYTYKVGINWPRPGGENSLLEAEGKYFVFAPMAVISADQLNVLYVGLDNPISVAVGGVEPSKVKVSIADTSVKLIEQGNGRYLVQIPMRKSNEVTASVVVKLNDRLVPMGSKKFKIRNLPKPSFRAGNISFNGLVSLSALKIQSTANAVLEEFVFEGVKFTIKSYTFTSIDSSGNKKEVVSNSASLLPIKEILNSLKAGDSIFFNNIHAIGPGGNEIVLDNANAVLK
jgi:gliding motility-associated protein GldM